MIKIYADFNDKTENDEYWILLYNGCDLSDQMESLGLSLGDSVILYQDPDDFEVLAKLLNRYVKYFDTEMLVAVPNWSTIKRL